MRATSATAISETGRPAAATHCGRKAFTLIEAIVALAIAAAAVIVLGTGLIGTLQVERAALQKRRAGIVARTLECADNAPALEQRLLDSGDGRSQFIKSVVEKDNRRWVVWQSYSDRAHGTELTIQFSAPD